MTHTHVIKYLGPTLAFEYSAAEIRAVRAPVYPIFMMCLCVCVCVLSVSSIVDGWQLLKRWPPWANDKLTLIEGFQHEMRLVEKCVLA